MYGRHIRCICVISVVFLLFVFVQVLHRFLLFVRACLVSDVGH